MPKEETMWKTQSGGLPDDFELVVEDASFGYRQSYNDGESELLIWVYEDANGEKQELLTSIGKHWTIAPDGRSVSSDQVKQFNNSSVWGRYIDRFMELNMGEVLSQPGRQDPREASACVGLKFQMKREMVKYGTGIEDKMVLMPQEFLGEVKSGKAKAAPTESKGASAAETKKAQLALKKLAKAADDAEGFQSAALDIVDSLPKELADRIYDDADCAALYEELTA